MRVLVADDEGLSRHILNDYLRSWGHEVVMASNGTEAWELLKQEDRPNIAILDWMMPGMDGVEVCCQLRNLDIPGYVYVIMLTAKNQPEDIIKGLESGVDDYVIKPFHPEELKYRIRIGERIINLEQKIMCLANIDYLTGLLNRRSFMKRLEGEINRVGRGQQNLGLIIADIDKFKIVNDCYGHQIGDLVLQDVAKCLLSAQRTYDFTGRYGGEEFIICLPGGGVQETAGIAERMRSILEQNRTDIPNSAGYIRVTASFGFTSVPAGSSKTLDALIKEADDALYQAKRDGRNRVIASAGC